MELQKKLPVEPVLEQFLLDLEKAETVSGSFITSMSFGEEGTDEATNLVEEYIQEAQGSTNAEEESVEENLTEDGIPGGIERLTVNLTVEAPSYFELEAFLKAIEETRRISKIDELSFSGNEEAISTNTRPEKLTYSLTISTFYYPRLVELKDQLPPLEIPNPSQKMNPLVPLISSNELETKEEEDEEANEIELNDNNTTEIIKHEVQPGETLYRISQKYYKDRSGEELIKQYNNLSDNTVYTGQILKIPLEK
jgi:type IV pilus assembly protein PilO